MKRYYDSYIVFSIFTVPYDTQYSMSFSIGWTSNDMLDYLCDYHSIDKDSIHETRQTLVKHYKALKDE